MDHNDENIEWRQNLFRHLIVGYSVEAGGITVDSKRRCKKCGKFFNFEVENEESHKLARRADFKQGDLTVCYECDKDETIIERGFKNMIGEPGIISIPLPFYFFKDLELKCFRNHWLTKKLKYGTKKIS